MGDEMEIEEGSDEFFVKKKDFINKMSVEDFCDDEVLCEKINFRKQKEEAQLTLDFFVHAERDSFLKFFPSLTTDSNLFLFYLLVNHRVHVQRNTSREVCKIMF
jgi:hypothetical protein